MAYKLPELGYAYSALAPSISEKQLRLHHEKHHKAYVDAANDLLEKLSKARKDSNDVDMKAMLKALSFNAAGHMLHSLFWKNLSPKPGSPSKKLLKAIEEEFGSMERFKKEFTQTAISTEGSGWAALAYDEENKRLMLMQIEKHNVNVVPSLKLLLVLDVWEHAYYLDYENARAKFVEAFWNIADLGEASKRFEKL